jgi:hypothetical protein
MYTHTKTKTKTEYKPRFNANDLKADLAKHVEELSKKVDEARATEEFAKYLDVVAKFHHYSPFNIWNIILTFPNATYVAGYERWKKLKRNVKKGEKGIPILAPIIVHNDGADSKSDSKVVGFRVVYVYDVSQTEGEPLPPPPDWKSLEKNELLQSKLTAFANSLGINVEVKEQKENVMGVSQNGGKIIEISPEAGVKTLIHEIAHSILHFGEKLVLTKAEKELEAEAVAYVVSKHFGIEGLNCPNYLALYDVKSGDIMAHFSAINMAATKIIEAVEGKNTEISEVVESLTE